MIQSSQVLLVAFLLSLACVASAQLSNGSPDQVKHWMVNEANLVQTSKGYAIASPQFAAHNWRTVFYNGDGISIIDSECRQVISSKQHMTKAELESLEDAKILCNSIEPNQPPPVHQTEIQQSLSAKYSLYGGEPSFSVANNVQTSTSNRYGLAVTKYDDQNMSIGLPRAPHIIVNRVFITGNFVTFVYNDAELYMKPIECLQPDEEQMVQTLMNTIEHAEGDERESKNQIEDGPTEQPSLELEKVDI